MGHRDVLCGNGYVEVVCFSGWHDWGKERAEETTFFAEYGCVFEDYDEVFGKRPEEGEPSEVQALRKYLREDEVCEYAKEKVLG